MSVPIVLEYLELMDKHQASDLYLTVGHPPSMRVENKLQNIRDDNLSSVEINDVLGAILTNRQRHEFDMKMELNTSLDAGKYGRYRVNVMRQRQNPALVIRRIISKIPDFKSLSLPPLMEQLSLEKRGLILVTGMTGSGKSTTLASMIDYRNSNEEGHVITIEDPIEFYHEHKKSVVTQREVGVDTESYVTALKNALRQRPDVILVGEIRDAQVMEQALTAAETGHLCLATLHTSNAYQAIDRIVNMFPDEVAYQQIRLSLSTNLKAIVAQRLVPNVSGGLTLAPEILLNQGLIKELIQKGEINKIREVMEQNRKIGMCTFDQSLFSLSAEGVITEQTALSNADMQGDLKIKIHQRHLENNGGGGALDTSEISISD